MSRSAAARATTAPERAGAPGRRPAPAGTGRPMKLFKGGARPARRERAAHLSLEAKVLLTAVSGLCLLGLPIVLSASAPGAILAGGSPWSYVIRQSIYMGLGAIAAVVVSRTPLAVVRKLRFALPLVAFSLLVVVFVPGLGHFAGGSSRWIGIGPFQLQPSELMKLAIVVFAADMLARRSKRPDQWRAFVWPLFLFMSVAAMLIVRQPDLGTAIVIGCITFSMLFAAGTQLRLLVLPGAAVCAAGAVFALSATYSRDRLLSFVDPFAHASTSGYQVVQSLATLGLGGVTGSGVGASITPWGFLPNAHTDFVFAVIAGNLGLVGALAVLAGFGAFGWAGFRIAARERDPFARFVAIGVTCWVLAQAVINIGGVVDALPVTGIPLPFISYGGSSLVVALIGVGLLFGIARRQPAAVTR
ncbi:MAG: putative lipid II flippase FtsW [Acidimicrobiales bacterium]